MSYYNIVFYSNILYQVLYYHIQRYILHYIVYTYTITNIYYLIQSYAYIGICSHAWAIARWKIHSFLTDILSYKYQVSAFDMVLNEYTRICSPMLIIGSNLTSPENRDHIGRFIVYSIYRYV